jgi:hypothetical protein
MRPRARAFHPICALIGSVGGGIAPALRGGAMAVALLACNIDNPGDEPPEGTLYFPTPLALSPHEPGVAARYLFVGNSNFDLRYKGGTVQAISLDALERETDGCTREDPCPIPDVGGVLEDEVFISSFVTALVASPDGRFLFATTRTDGSLSFMPLDAEADGDAVLDCGKSDRNCGLLAARAPSTDRPDEAQQWPNDPAAVSSGPLSHWTGNPDDESLYALVAHRGGEVSLFIETDAAIDSPGRFELRSVLRGLPVPLTNIGFDPPTGLAHLTVGAQGLARAGVVAPQGDELGSLYYAGTIGFQSLASAPDARDLTFLPAVPGAGDALADDTALVVANQPSALLLVDLDAADGRADVARVKRTAVVGAGASRVTTGMLGGRPTAVVACFDARALFVIDLQTMLTRSVVPNLSGPYDLELDEQRQRVYLADFRSSVIRVIDLSELARTQGEASAAVIATLGRPRVLQELQ